MKALVLGCGNIGSVAAEDLAQSKPSVQVTVSDNDRKRAETVANRIGTSNASAMQLDTSNPTALKDALRKHDLILGFLPAKLSYRLAEACITTRKSLVDVSYMGEDPLALNARAAKAGVAIVPDCGLAPGISNVLVGHAASKLDKVKTVHIMVGGLPEKPVPPLGYVITWSPESLVDEYTRKAGIVHKGRRTEVEALSGVEQLNFPGAGRLEAFFTDGLRTLVHTIGGVDEMWEKTLRYPGHAEKMEAFRSLGFFDDKPVDVAGTRVSPRALTVKLLAQKLTNPKICDIVVMKVEVSGVKDHKKTSYTYHMLDRCDKKRGITSMARTTAYPASIVAQQLLKRTVKEKGVVPPEKLGMHSGLFRTFMDELARRGVSVKEQKKTG